MLKKKTKKPGILQTAKSLQKKSLLQRLEIIVKAGLLSQTQADDARRKLARGKS